MSSVGLRLDPTTGGIQQTNQTDAVTQAQTTGLGAVGVSGTVPDLVPQLYTSVLSSLRTMAPAKFSGDFEVLLAEVTSKLKDALGKVMEGRVNNEMETKRVSIQENQAKIEESKRKLDEAQAKKESGDIGDILSLIFEAIGATLLAALGALLSALPVPGLQALGTALIISAILMFISVANSVVAKANDGAGILGSIAKAIAEGSGASSEDISTAVAAADGVFAAAMLIASIAAIVMTGGAAGEAGISNFLNGVIKGIEVGTAIGSAAANVVSTSYGMAAAVDTRDAKMAQADSQDLQAFMQQLDDMIDMAMALLMQVNQNANAMMDTLSQMLNDQGNALSNTQFAG